MLRALLLGLVMLAAAGPALAAGDIETCRNSRRNPPHGWRPAKASSPTTRSPAPPGPPPSGIVGDALVKKRDYDGAIAVFNSRPEIEPRQYHRLNARGIAYS